MLPAVTSENVEAAVDLLQILGISQIELQSLVAAQLSVFLPSTGTVLNLIVIRDLTARITDIPTRGGRVVETEVQVGAETIEELELIVELGITHETTNIRVLILLIEHGYRVQR